MVPWWFVTPCRQEMRGVFVIFLLTAVKNIAEKKGGRGTAGLQKRLKKSHKRQTCNFFSLFFFFSLFQQKIKNKKHP